MEKIHDSNLINIKKLKKSYGKSYSLALHSNDISTIKQLTNLKQPIPLKDGISVLKSLFVLQLEEDMALYGPILSYIYYNGISNSKSEENEKNILVYNGFGFHIEEFIIDILNNVPKNIILNTFPLEFCYYHISHMHTQGITQPLKLWKEKKLPQKFENEKLLTYSYQNKNNPLFSQFLNCYSDYIGIFLSNYQNFDSMSYWIKKTIEDNIYKLDDIDNNNLFYVSLIVDFLKSCSNNLWINTTEQLDKLSQLPGHNLLVSSFIDFINNNRLFLKLDEKIEDNALKNKINKSSSHEIHNKKKI